MTAVVLAAGHGRRLQASDNGALTSAAQRAAAARGLKVLMPVGDAGRPLIDYVLARLAEAGCTDVVLVVPPDHEALATHLTRHTPTALRVRFALQPRPTGTAGALAAAAPAIAAPAFLVVNGDNLYPVPAVRALMALDGCGLAGFSCASLEHDSGFTPARIAAFAAVECDAAGWLTGMREKPPADVFTPSTLVSMNLWRLDATVLDACRDVTPSTRGEHELPDAVLLAVARGTRVRVVAAAGAVLDLTAAADVPVISRALRGSGARV